MQGGGELTLPQAVVLGALQGPTELLPLSSSGHLVLVPRVLGWRYAELEAELRKSFEVALHAGTAAALLIGLRREVAEYLREFGPHNVVTLTLSFAPAAFVAKRYERRIERSLSDPRTVAFALLAGSIAMAAADGRPEERDRDDTRPMDAIVIGIAQACALAPGVSRNGATLTAARLLRFRRRDANVISRQIALPVIVGAVALKGARLFGRRDIEPSVKRGMAAGAGAAFASTLLSLRLITMLERSRSLRPYAAYRAVVALGVLAALRRRSRPSPARSRVAPERAQAVTAPVSG